MVDRGDRYLTDRLPVGLEHVHDAPVAQDGDRKLRDTDECRLPVERFGKRFTGLREEANACVGGLPRGSPMGLDVA